MKQYEFSHKNNPSWCSTSLSIIMIIYESLVLNKTLTYNIKKSTNLKNSNGF